MENSKSIWILLAAVMVFVLIKSSSCARRERAHATLQQDAESVIVEAHSAQQALATPRVLTQMDGRPVSNTPPNFPQSAVKAVAARVTPAPDTRDLERKFSPEDLGARLDSETISGEELLKNMSTFENPPIGTTLETPKAGYIYWLESRALSRIDFHRFAECQEEDGRPYCMRMRIEVPGTSGWKEFESQNGRLEAFVISGDPYQQILKLHNDYYVHLRWRYPKEELVLPEVVARSLSATTGHIYSSKDGRLILVGKMVMMTGSWNPKWLETDVDPEPKDLFLRILNLKK